MNFSSFDQRDKINCLYLAMSGYPLNQTYSASEMSSYIEYIRQLSEVSSAVKTRANSQILTNLDFFENYNSKLRKASSDVILSEESMLDLIEKIQTHRSNEFTNEEFEFVFGENRQLLIDFINSLKLPRLERVISKQDPFVNEIRKFAKDDPTFNRQIKHVYRVSRRSRRRDPNSKVLRVSHGTTNLSLLKILDGGFKRPSELNDSDVRFSGQLLGDGVYFTKLKHIGKNATYTDSNEETAYIIIADVYYDELLETHEITTFDLQPHQIGIGYNMGGYGRDEVLALPHQIDIKYVLEITK